MCKKKSTEGSVKETKGGEIKIRKVRSKNQIFRMILLLHFQHTKSKRHQGLLTMVHSSRNSIKWAELL